MEWLESMDEALERVDLPLLLTMPHAGEWVPPEAEWLKGFSQSLLLTDIDRFVDDLYFPALQQWNLPRVLTRVLRYACDLNRLPEDVDAATVEGAPLPVGQHATGLHWGVTMNEDVLISKPLSRELHEEIVKKYFAPFHERIRFFRERLQARFPKNRLYHLDCHSMPSYPTSMHTDQGKGHRAEVVLSDQDGRTASPEYREIVNRAFLSEGFQAVWNDPYKGGRITQIYGKPSEGSEAIQIELRRDLYMNEQDFSKLPGQYEELQSGLSRVMARIVPELRELCSSRKSHF